MQLKAQGATEYLILLAVVLIIALVGIALLGFFPGAASDAQVAENELYWKSAAPFAVVETGGRYSVANGSEVYLRIRNNGNYRARITKFLTLSSTCPWGPNNCNIEYYQNEFTSYHLLSEIFDMAPGEERVVGDSYYFPGLPDRNHITFWTAGGLNPYNMLNGAARVCASSLPYGNVEMPLFGFEYVQYVEGQQITKREIGAKPLMMKCKF